MKLHFTTESLKEQILRDGVVDVEAGIPLLEGAPLERFIPREEGIMSSKKEGASAPVLRVLVHQVRRRDGMSIAKFADTLRVEAVEIETIENDPGYTPRPRTLHQLATYLGVSASAVQSLTPDAVVRNDNIEHAAVKFAASSDDLTALSKSERRNLNDFVKVLASYDKGKS